MEMNSRANFNQELVRPESTCRLVNATQRIAYIVYTKLFSNSVDNFWQKHLGSTAGPILLIESLNQR